MVVSSLRKRRAHCIESVVMPLIDQRPSASPVAPRIERLRARHVSCALSQLLARVFALVNGPISEPYCRRCIKTNRAIYVRLHWAASRKTRGHRHI